MPAKYTVPLKIIVKELNLEPLHLSSKYDSTLLSMSEINRPALQLAGFYNYFDPKRLQAIGKVETTYLETLTHDDRMKAFEQFMAYDIVGLVVCHGCKTFPECLAMASCFVSPPSRKSRTAASFVSTYFFSIYQFRYYFQSSGKFSIFH